QRREGKAGQFLGNPSLGVHYVHPLVWVSVAAPDLFWWLGGVDHSSRLGGPRVEMIGETGSPERRKHVIGKDKIARIREIVRDIGLPHLGVGKHGTVHVSV